ncbi:rRNA methyltransferase [Paremcibacter congregatus]|uniref:tRNA (cytidine/uridine-2'-O-)-methyltransferase TrmJ n=2 Tax=Paremcibacter congregatus TaxID=2043170 RepID=A0A2G4YSQ3_9PROT|nr:rRNA methyltransferase [Paremcibacter congregatus]QDE29245.1 RNA methyltransferase [Paremcibacter congregatus]|tara:strand:- start:209 stop:1054 length:846 start_codon:yes stop_codon:yes gene_type:complete
MAGTNHTEAEKLQQDGPAIILIGAQLGENIGKAVRAMYNFGLTDLRLVAPRDGWPNPAAVPAAAGADIVLEKAQVFETTAEAIADLSFVYATTARRRDMIKTVVTPRKCASLMREHATAGQKFGLLFGPEKAGLKNDDVALADAIVSVPLNPAFASINLAQAVILMSYEWFQTGADQPDQYTPQLDTTPATSEDLQKLFDHMEVELTEAGYFRHAQRRATMKRNLRNIFKRADMTKEEVSTLRGVIKALATGGGPGWLAEKAELGLDPEGGVNKTPEKDGK